MGNDWPIVKLGDYCKKIGSGATPKGGSSVYLDLGDVCLIRSQNIYNEGFSESGLVYIDDIAATKLKNVEVEKNDVLLNITGDSVARVCLAPSDFLPARVNQHVAIIRPNAAEFDARFLRYLLASPKTQKLLLNLASAGATRNALTKGMIEDFEVSKPPVSVQTGIANLLESLDNKITLNSQINQTLEQMAQTLFKSWFVDFDPVIDNALDAGFFEQDWPIPDELQHRAEARKTVRESEGFKPLPDEVRQLFPDAFEESELGWVPKGWVYRDAESVASVSIGKTPPRKESRWFSETPSDNVTWVSIRDMGGYGAFTGRSSEYLTQDAVSKFNVKRVPKDSVLLSFKLTLGRVAIAHNELTTNEAIAHFINPKFGLNKEFLYSYLSTFDYDRLGSTSSIATAVNSKIIKRMPILVPTESASSAFEYQVGPLFEKMKLIDSEITTLTELRDTLLPKLISGELRLDEVELAVEQEAVSAEQQNER